MNNNKNIFTAIVTCSFLAGVALAQSGPPFEITQSVISNGGGTSNGAPYSLTGTTGQSVAGTNSSGGGFGVSGGFWQPVFAPTAAMVAVSGRVATADGRGIRNARLTLTGVDGIIRMALTGPFGYFRFDDVAAGQTYIISIHSKRYVFANPTQIISVSDEITDLVFTADPQ